jgi:outer membrane receptor for ferrienterochelin and colicins
VLSASGRLDALRDFGTVLNPRVSILVRPGASWTVRAGGGTGHFAPVPFTDETEALGVAVLLPLGELKLERARGATLDVGWTAGPLELNGAAFASRVHHALHVQRVGDGRLELVNADLPTHTHGADLLARYHGEPLHVIATYTFTRSTEADPESGSRREVPLTPRHAAGVVAMVEMEESGRLGAEFYYTGRQQLDDDPYRSASRPYIIVGVLAERRFGRVRAFLNAENLLDARQTRHTPLLRPARTPEGRWTTDAWGPLEGRTLNAGVRIEF